MTACAAALVALAHTAARVIRPPTVNSLIRPHASRPLAVLAHTAARDVRPPTANSLIRPHASYGPSRPSCPCRNALLGPCGPCSYGRMRRSASYGQLAHTVARVTTPCGPCSYGPCDVRPPTANSLMRPHAPSVAIASGPVALAVHIRCKCNSRDPAFAALLGPFRRWELLTGDPYLGGKRQASGRTGDADKIKRIQGSSGAERSQIMHMRQIQGRSMSSSGAEPRYAYDLD